MDVMVSHVTRTVGGEEIKFAKMTVRERAQLLKKIKERRRPQFIETLERAKRLYVSVLKDTPGIEPSELLDRAGLSAQEFINEIDAFDHQLLGVDDLLRYINQPEGYVEVTEAACRKLNGDRCDEIMDRLVLDDMEAVTLAAEISCIKLMWVERGTNKPAAPGGQAAPDGQADGVAAPERPSVPAS